MSHAWMPGAGRLPAEADGGPMRGGAPRVVWQSLACDPRLVSARSAAQRLRQLGRPSHLVWNPLTGETVQLISIIRAACSLGGAEDLELTGPAGPAERAVLAERGFPAGTVWQAFGQAAVNAEGRLCAQICVVASAWEPFTSGPMTGLLPIVRWLDSWGISRRWPAGRPAPYPPGHAASRSRRLWARGGHFGASQVPGWAASGPGSIDVELITGPAVAPAAGLPRDPDVTGQSSQRPPRPAVPRPEAPHPGVTHYKPARAELAGLAGAGVPATPLTRVS